MWLGVLVGALSLSLSLGSPHGKRSDASNLIFGGVPQHHPFPPLVQLFWHKFDAFCGGTLLTNSHVLTAASCLSDSHFLNIDLKGISVFAGLTGLTYEDMRSPGVQWAKVANALVHPLWGNGSFANDIAILVLEKDIEYTETVQPIKIYANDWLLEQNNYPSVAIVGFGNREYYNSKDWSLNLAYTQIVPRHNCSNIRANIPRPVHITLEQICTLTRTQEPLGCDRGGPVIHFLRNALTNRIEVRQVGIYSSFTKVNENMLNVHTRASWYCTWITQSTQGKYLCVL